MAAIGKIRKQSGLLIVLIGGAMVLFLLSDMFSSGASFLTQEEQTIGSIAGDEIALQEFELRVQDAIDRQYGVEGANEKARKNIRNRVWQDMVRERVLETEMASLGLTVSPDELLNNVKNVQPGSVLYQYFTDPNTGQVIEDFRNPDGSINGQRVLQAINNLLNSENSSDWLPIEKAIKQDILMNKYSTLLSKGLVSTAVEASQVGSETNASVEISYVVKEFSSVEVEEPTEEELRAYYNEHRTQERFKQETQTRSVKLAYAELMATPEDIDAIQLELSNLIPAFKNDSNDTAFVGENADGMIDQLVRYVSVQDVMPALQPTLDSAKVNDVFGPFAEGDRFVIKKLLNIKYEPDSVRASHILISTQEGDTAQIAAARAKLDSLKNVAQKNKNFEELAEEFSEDFGSAQNGGDLNWFTRGRMVAPFEKASFEGAVGDMVIVESQFGVHLINITDRTKEKPKYLLATVDRIVEPSKATSDMIYQRVSKFAIENRDIETFDGGLEEGMMMDADPNVAMIDESVGPIEDGREIVRWVFEAEEKEVSNPFETERFIVVAAVDGITEEGIMEFEDAKSLIYNEVLNKKKAEKIIADLGSYASLEDAAKVLGNPVKMAPNVSFGQSSLPGGLGRELKMLGAAYGLPEGQVSKPIQGTRGVFVIRVDSKTTPDAESIDLTQFKRKGSDEYGARVNSQLYDALQKVKGVDDQRAKYY